MGGPTFAGFDDQNRNVLLRGPFGAPYVINPDTAATFKFAHGDLVTPRKGPDADRLALVLGELHSTLWIHYLDESHAVPLKFCSTYAQLLEKHDLQHAQPPRSAIGAQSALGATLYFQTVGLFNKFGVHPSERVHLGAKQKSCTIVGELLGILWVKFDDTPTIASPLPNATSEDALRSLYTICEEPTVKGMTPVPSPRKTPRSSAAPPFVVDNAQEVATCSQPFGKVEVNITSAAVREAFSVAHGQRLTAKRGTLAGSVCTVVGVRGGNLFVHVEGDKHVTMCRNCTDGADLHEVYGFEISGVKPKAPVAPVKTPSKPKASPRPLPAEDVGSPTTIHPPRHFKCWTAFGRMDFDSSEAGCKPFGFFHQQSVKASVGPDSGKLFHIVGERMGSLWVVEDGKARASTLSHCKDFEDIKKRYGFVVVGKQNLKYLSQMATEPPPTPINSPRVGGSTPRGIMHTPRGVTASVERNTSSAPVTSPVPMLNLSAAAPPMTEQREPSAPSAAYEAFATSASPSPSPGRGTDSSRNVEDPWVDGRMPATRHYLKAVALLKTGAASSASAPTAFHHYYASNSSQRLSQALRQMQKFRQAWGDEHVHSSVPCAFSHATTDEMFSFMRNRRDLFV